MRSSELPCKVFLAFPLVFTLLVFVRPSQAQQSTFGTSSFANINIGFGIPYGGIGANAEFGKGHLSLHAGFGYAFQSKSDTITIEDTWNWQVGARYYINVKSEILYPRVGLSYGWITNYYSNEIGNATYDQNVYGFSVHIGTQFYTLEGLVVSVDISGSSSAFIANVGNHPHFFPVYIRPSVGIGLDISSLFKGFNKDKKLKNKALDPFG